MKATFDRPWWSRAPLTWVRLLLTAADMSGFLTHSPAAAATHAQAAAPGLRHTACCQAAARRPPPVRRLCNKVTQRTAAPARSSCGMLSARSLAAGRPLLQRADFMCPLCCLTLAETALVGRRTSIVYVLPVPVCPYLRKSAGLSIVLSEPCSTSVLRQGKGSAVACTSSQGQERSVRARKDGAVEALEHLLHDWCDRLHVQLLLARLWRKHLNQRHPVSQNQEAQPNIQCSPAWRGSLSHFGLHWYG